jgi:hypothetical protein
MFWCENQFLDSIYIHTTVNPSLEYYCTVCVFGSTDLLFYGSVLAGGQIVSRSGLHLCSSAASFIPTTKNFLVNSNSNTQVNIQKTSVALSGRKSTGKYKSSNNEHGVQDPSTPTISLWPCLVGSRITPVTKSARERCHQQPTASSFFIESLFVRHQIEATTKYKYKIEYKTEYKYKKQLFEKETKSSKVCLVLPNKGKSIKGKSTENDKKEIAQRN